MVHPFMPQGNALVRQETLPIPQSNVAETSYFALAQDMMILQWPAIQLTYDSPHSRSVLWSTLPQPGRDSYKVLPEQASAYSRLPTVTPNHEQFLKG